MTDAMRDAGLARHAEQLTPGTGVELVRRPTETPVMEATPVYRLTVTPPVWNGNRGGWVGGAPIVSEYATVGELHAALVGHGVPRAVAMGDYSSWRDAEWGPVVPVRVPEHVLKLALGIYRQMSASYAEYEEACEQDHRRGHTAHYCEHGTNRWTDYDNICGPCEDGRSLRDPMVRRRVALDQAQERHRKAKAMIKWACEAHSHGMADVVDMEAVTRRYETLMGV